MANPRQRRKARSSHNPVRHSRQAKKLLKKQPRVLGFLWRLPPTDAGVLTRSH